MIEPGQRTIRDLQKGEVVEGTVTRILPYGAFVDIGVGRDALLHVREMGEGFIAKPEDVVQVGQIVEARIIEIARRRSRVDLSMKGLRPEPEPQHSAAPGTRSLRPNPNRSWRTSLHKWKSLHPCNWPSSGRRRRAASCYRHLPNRVRGANALTPTASVPSKKISSRAR